MTATVDRTVIVMRSERETAMAAGYLAGSTLQEVGDSFGVSRERVRQLFARAGMPTRHTRRRGESWERFARMGKFRRELDARRKAERRHQVVVLRSLAESLGRSPTLKELTDLLGTSIPSIAQLWSGRPFYLTVGEPQRYSKRLARLFRVAGVTRRVRGFHGRMQ